MSAVLFLLSVGASCFLAVRLRRRERGNQRRNSAARAVVARIGLF
jgi:hypothetical protein